MEKLYISTKATNFQISAALSLYKNGPIYIHYKAVGWCFYNGNIGLK